MTTPHSRTQRLTARSIVAAFVILGLVILFVPSGALGSMFGLQQQTGSPTGSPTSTGSPTQASPSPSPTGVQEIQFYNPSANSTVISTKNDGTDTTYHLVAVTRQMPANPLVEFKYQIGTANEVSIGIASRVGATDAFEFNWPVSGLSDGSITLKAILYNGSLELGRDQISATINNADTLESPQAEAVEITYPRNGTRAGFFQPQGAATAFTVVNTTSSVALAPPSTSRGTSSVQLRYTKTPPGQEPVWTNCGTATPSSTGTTSSRCTLASGDTPAMVTGIAAQASQQISQLATGSGDAHRVFPYEQVPTSITLNPAAQSGKAAGACSDAITATILDQNNQPIAGVNTDVHAKGPADSLRFDDSGDNSSAHQAPDKAHTAPEQAWNCEGTGGNGNQGDHELSPGNPDIKHIETTGTGTQATTGTDNAGQFKFQLYSPDGPGSTEIVVFADTDDDDQWCAEETSGNGSIGWSPNPSPSPSPTSSPTRTSSPTGAPTSGGPTPTPEPTTLQPERATCPRATGSPSPTGSPGPGNRSMNLDVSRGVATAGARVTLSGVVQSQDTACEDGVPVEITRRIHGTNNFREFRTTATDEEGNYSVRARVKKSADYQASVAEAGNCDAASSEAEDVRVRVKVTRNASDDTPNGGSTVTISGKVSPNHRGDKAVLQRKKGKKWVKVDTDKLDQRSRYAFELEVTWDGERRFRVRWPKQAPSNLAGSSRPIALRAT